MFSGTTITPDVYREVVLVRILSKAEMSLLRKYFAKFKKQNKDSYSRRWADGPGKIKGGFCLHLQAGSRVLGLGRNAVFHK